FGFTSLEGLMEEGSSNDTEDLAVAISITDREGATAFIDSLFEQNDVTVTRTETESFTKVVNPDAEGVLYILDDALIFSMTTEGLDFEAAQRDNLSTNADFTAALALLPAADY